MRIQRPCNMHGTWLLYNSNSYVAFERKKHYHVLYYLPPLSQLRFLFTNELSASGIAVLCSDQKFVNDNREKYWRENRDRDFLKKSNRNRSKLKKSRIVTTHHTMHYTATVLLKSLYRTCRFILEYIPTSIDSCLCKIHCRFDSSSSWWTSVCVTLSAACWVLLVWHSVCWHSITSLCYCQLRLTEPSTKMCHAVGDTSSLSCGTSSFLPSSFSSTVACHLKHGKEHWFELALMVHSIDHFTWSALVRYCTLSFSAWLHFPVRHSGTSTLMSTRRCGWQCSYFTVQCGASSVLRQLRPSRWKCLDSVSCIVTTV